MPSGSASREASHGPKSAPSVPPTAISANSRLPCSLLKRSASSAQNTIVTAIRAAEGAAFDYLPKPFDFDELIAALELAAERLAAKEQQTREEQERATGKKKRGRKPKQPDEVVDTDAKANMTDPDSRILKTRRGWVQGYNGQAVADCASQVIVACDITQDENDVLQLGAMLEQCERQAGQCPDEMSADAGYWSVANSRLGGDATELYIATNKDWKQRKALREKGPPRGRIPRSATARDLMERKLLTKRGRDVYRQRGSTIEPVFGQMVTRGLVRFLLRGVEKVRAEWALWCATHNLLKLYRHGWCPS